MTIQNLNHLVEDKIDQNRINLVGIELEGYFDEKPNMQGSFKGDGSLRGFDERNYNDDNDDYDFGGGDEVDDAVFVSPVNDDIMNYFVVLSAQ